MSLWVLSEQWILRCHLGMQWVLGVHLVVGSAVLLMIAGEFTLLGAAYNGVNPKVTGTWIFSSHFALHCLRRSS